MFLMATLLPVLLATLFRFIVLVALVFLAAAVTNPSDHSFALWISQQNEPSDLVPDASVGVSKWISAVYKTAKSLVCHEPLTWCNHNALVFSIVHVPSRERYAFGVFGTWRWADESVDYVKALCQSPWVIKISRGGVMSGIDRYCVDSGSLLGSGSLRRRRGAESMGHQMDSTGFETQSHRQIRAKALQCKIRKDWKSAAALFLEAAKAASALVTQANYELEAAWCTLETMDTFSCDQNEVMQKIRLLCDTLASAGYFDEAARGLSELAFKIKRKFPTECKMTARAKEVAELYWLAKEMAESGGSLHSAAENGLWAASVYADAGLWALAEKCFEAVGEIRRGNGQNELANEAYGNAVLCRLGQLDFVGAEEMLNRFTEYMGENHRSSDMDLFLSSLLQACNKWSLQMIDKAIQHYDSKHRLAPWQRHCLTNLEEKLNDADLR